MRLLLEWFDFAVGSVFWCCCCCCGCTEWDDETGVGGGLRRVVDEEGWMRLSEW
jgi:hypothetical protein